MAKILLVDDDVRLARALDDWLTAEGHDVEVINEGHVTFKRALEEPFQVLILDWDVPGMSGVEICQQYLESGGTGRVIMLTGKTAVKDRVKGLDAGADDYLTKPFNPEELSARVRALSRRAQTDSKVAMQTAIICGYLRLEPLSKDVFKDSVPVKLNAKEFSLLQFFMSNPNQVFSSNDLLNSVWSQESEVSPDAIRVYITRIREKIDRDKENSVIKTIHAVGYKFVPPL